MGVDAELIGLAAGSLTTVSFVPQVIKVWRSRSAGDLSLTMFVCFCLGVALWIGYGALIGSLAVVAANTVTLVLAAAILVGRLRFGGGRPAAAKAIE